MSREAYENRLADYICISVAYHRGEVVVGGQTRIGDTQIAPRSRAVSRPFLRGRLIFSTRSTNGAFCSAAAAHFKNPEITRLTRGDSGPYPKVIT